MINKVTELAGLFLDEIGREELDGSDDDDFSASESDETIPEQ